jgi:hypothetical protein
VGEHSLVRGDERVDQINVVMRSAGHINMEVADSAECARWVATCGKHHAGAAGIPLLGGPETVGTLRGHPETEWDEPR